MALLHIERNVDTLAFPESFVLLSQRAYDMTTSEQPDITRAHHRWQDLVIASGTAKQCCRLANRDYYGRYCCVADSQGTVQWSWHRWGHWSPRRYHSLSNRVWERLARR